MRPRQKVPFTVMMLACLWLAGAGTASGQDWFIRGDANGDGQVTYPEDYTMTSTCMDALDWNDDGLVNLADVALMALRWPGGTGEDTTVKPEPPFPECGPDPTPEDGLTCIEHVYCVVPDSDGDGFLDPDDNCPDAWNPSQADTDGDGVGDHCDAWNCDNRFDDDYDGVPDDCDICPDGNDLVDANENGTPDDCEGPCLYPGPGPVGGPNDADHDGYDSYAGGGCDCDDHDPLVYPYAKEYCDGLDNNCDEVTDPHTAVDAVPWHADADGDTYGSPVVVGKSCDPLPGCVANALDCADWDAALNPDATEEACNGIDEDCDGVDGYGCTGGENTPVGAPVAVTVMECTITYETVTSEGTTEVTRTDTGPDPAGFAILPRSLGMYYDINTTAGHSGQIEVCVAYSDMLFGEEDDESLLSLRHWNGATWKDITSSHDDVNNVICGTTDALSPFALGMPSADCPVVKTGDVELSGAITSADIIYLVGYVFKGGAEPLPCAAAGDANCSGSITSADIIWLVTHVFKSGDPPCDVCTLIPGTWSCP